MRNSNANRPQHSVAAIALVLLGLGGWCVMVSTTQSQGEGVDLPRSTPMPPGKRTDEAPPGFISFCNRYPYQCYFGTEATSIHLDLQSEVELERVDRSVNHSLSPEDDRRHYDIAEYWTIPADGYGSCHDYALTKRWELMQAGYPGGALRIAIVETPETVRHAILTVVTDDGDFVLDNLNDEVKPWRATPYRWLERQDGGGGLGWVSFTPSDMNAGVPTSMTDDASRLRRRHG